MNDDFRNNSIDPEMQVRLMNLVMGEASDFERDQLQALMEQRGELAAYYHHLEHLHGLLCEVGAGDFFPDDSISTEQPKSNHGASNSDSSRDDEVKLATNAVASAGTESDTKLDTNANSSNQQAEASSTGDSAWKLSADRRQNLLAVLDGSANNSTSSVNSALSHSATNKAASAPIEVAGKKPWWRKRPSLLEMIVLASCVLLVVGLLTPATQSARESARRVASENKFSQYGLARKSEFTGGTTQPLYLSDDVQVVPKSDSGPSLFGDHYGANDTDFLAGSSTAEGRSDWFSKGRSGGDVNELNSLASRQLSRMRDATKIESLAEADKSSLGRPSAPAQEYRWGINARNSAGATERGEGLNFQGQVPVPVPAIEAVEQTFTVSVPRFDSPVEERFYSGVYAGKSADGQTEYFSTLQVPSTSAPIGGGKALDLPQSLAYHDFTLPQSGKPEGKPADALDGFGNLSRGFNESSSDEASRPAVDFGDMEIRQQLSNSESGVKGYRSPSTQPSPIAQSVGASNGAKPEGEAKPGKRLIDLQELEASERRLKLGKDAAKSSGEADDFDFVKDLDVVFDNSNSIGSAPFGGVIGADKGRKSGVNAPTDVKKSEVQATEENSGRLEDQVRALAVPSVETMAIAIPSAEDQEIARDANPKLGLVDEPIDSPGTLFSLMGDAAIRLDDASKNGDQLTRGSSLMRSITPQIAVQEQEEVRLGEISKSIQPNYKLPQADLGGDKRELVREELRTEQVELKSKAEPEPAQVLAAEKPKSSVAREELSKLVETYDEFKEKGELQQAKVVADRIQTLDTKLFSTLGDSVKEGKETGVVDAMIEIDSAAVPLDSTGLSNESWKELSKRKQDPGRVNVNTLQDKELLKKLAESTIIPEGSDYKLSEGEPSYRSIDGSVRGRESVARNQTASEGQISLGGIKRNRQPEEYIQSNSNHWMYTPAPSPETIRKGLQVAPQQVAQSTPAKTKAESIVEEQLATKESFSTFSLHVSDVSFKLAQSALAQGQLPDASKIRIEEFVNAMDYRDPLPTASQKVSCALEQAIHPFLMQRNLLRISMRTSAAGRSANTPLRLTILLDNSGSMERPDRRQAVQRAFQTLIQQLNANDQITLISFASTPRLLADKVVGNQGESLLQLIENLPSEGGTNIEAALLLAREKALEQKSAGAQNRIVLMTDGAVNLGDADPSNLSKLVTQLREAGIAFDAAGICAQDLNDEVLEALARQGDGRYYLLDTPESIGGAFAAQIAGALRPTAQNVKVQVEFNPQRVGKYKLLGFEKHRLSKEDFRNDRVDAAELAAAEAGVAVYQLEPLASGSGDIGSVSVRFRDVTTGRMIEQRWPIAYDACTPRLEVASPSMRLAGTATMLAAKLAGGPLAESVELSQLPHWLANLPEPYASHSRTQQLRTMIQQLRSIRSE